MKPRIIADFLTMVFRVFQKYMRASIQTICLLVTSSRSLVLTSDKKPG